MYFKAVDTSFQRIFHTSRNFISKFLKEFSSFSFKDSWKLFVTAIFGQWIEFLWIFFKGISFVVLNFHERKYDEVLEVYNILELEIFRFEHNIESDDGEKSSQKIFTTKFLDSQISGCKSCQGHQHSLTVILCSAQK